ncbi:scoloptoxin SSD14 [Drosophila nasuta]|uniref:scoloptoxin SSD14 n=1 Tax=Drosophila nasuta TaxID=42062 RepID=UPI00295F39E8|nr:scoloptoxin SSD14 [Drosophila nasuta]
MSKLTEYAVIWILLIVAIGCLVLGLIFGLGNEVDGRIGAVASNGVGCAEIGGQMLDVGGSAADAAIATMLCEGVMLPHSLGVGGGFVATIYNKATGQIETLIARETAPAAATQDMFVNLTKDDHVTGALSCAVPSEIFGYWKLHVRLGKLPWRALFEPTIELCRNGITVSLYLAGVLANNEEHIRRELSMSEIFINPATERVYRVGEVMYRHVLADTLEIIATEGAEVLYRGGRVGRMLVEDIQEMGGIITEQDLQSYNVRWEEPLRSSFGHGYDLYTTPLPTSGALLIFIVNVMDKLHSKDMPIETYWHRLVESFKHAYGQRSNLGDLHFEPSVRPHYRKLIDPRFADKIRALIRDDVTFEDIHYYGANFSSVEDHGTAHISVLAPNGDAISVTSTINGDLGARLRSRQTGFILNDQMNDFSKPGSVNAFGIPDSPANYIKPGKRPMSSACPSIVLDKQGNVQLVVGGAGGPKITTSVAQAILRYFVLKESVYNAVNSGRLHHQLVPMHVELEPSVPRRTADHLEGIGHKLSPLSGHRAYSALTAIGSKENVPDPICDYRREGSAVLVGPSLDYV